MNLPQFPQGSPKFFEPPEGRTSNQQRCWAQASHRRTGTGAARVRVREFEVPWPFKWGDVITRAGVVYKQSFGVECINGMKF